MNDATTGPCNDEIEKNAKTKHSRKSNAPTKSSPKKGKLKDDSLYDSGSEQHDVAIVQDTKSGDGGKKASKKTRSRKSDPKSNRDNLEENKMQDNNPDTGEKAPNQAELQSDDVSMNENDH